MRAHVPGTAPRPACVWGAPAGPGAQAPQFAPPVTRPDAAGPFVPKGALSQGEPVLRRPPAGRRGRGPSAAALPGAGLGSRQTGADAAALTGSAPPPPRPVPGGPALADRLPGGRRGFPGRAAVEWPAHLGAAHLRDRCAPSAASRRWRGASARAEPCSVNYMDSVHSPPRQPLCVGDKSGHKGGCVS